MATESDSHGEVRPGRIRRKVGLEMPLSGRIWRETRLTFGPPLWHDILVACCLLAVPAWLFSRFVLALPVIGRFPFWVWAAVGLGGVWALLSSERMVVDLARRTYFRLEGKGPLKTVSRGSIDEFDALVLMTEQYPVPTLSGRLVIYRLVFYWKESREPLLIAAREEKTIKRSDPLNAGSGALRVSGEQFARLMGVPFFDNSWFHSKKPLPPV